MFTIVSIASALVLSAAAERPPVDARPLSLEEAVKGALERNPDLMMLRAEVDAARARLDGASRLLAGNPEVQLALGPRSDSRTSTLDYSVQLSQPIEIAGQRGARVEAAEAGLAAAEARLQARQVALAADVQEAFGRALAAMQLVALQGDGLALAREALQAAEDRLRAGAASRIEVNTARVEVGRSIRELSLAQQQQAMTLAELTLLLGPGTPEPIVIKGELVIPTEVTHPDAASIKQAAMASRRDLMAARHELVAAQAGQRLAGREAAPTPRLGAAYAREEQARIIQGTLTFELPLFNRNQAARGMTSAQVAQARQVLQALEQRIEQEARLAATRHQVAHDAAQAYAGGVVQAMQENLSLVSEGYRAGKIDFFQLLVIRRETLDARRGYIEALAELNTAEALLNRALGRLP